MRKTKFTLSLGITVLSIALLGVGYLVTYVRAQGAPVSSQPANAQLNFSPKPANMQQGSDVALDARLTTQRYTSSSDRYRRIEQYPNASFDSSGNVVAGPAVGEMRSVAVMAGQSFYVPLSSAVLHAGDRIQVKFRFRAGKDGAGDLQTQWSTPGGWRNGGLFGLNIYTKTSQPVSGFRSATPTNLSDVNRMDALNPLTFNKQKTGTDKPCYEGASSDADSTWCSYSFIGQVPTGALNDGSAQWLSFRVGAQVDKAWFVGELQVDDLELYIVDASNTPTTANLVAQPQINSSFESDNGLADWGADIGLTPANKYFSKARAAEGANHYLSYTSKNYKVVWASSADPSAVALLQLANFACGNGKFKQNVSSSASCYSNAADVPAGAIVYYDQLGSTDESFTMRMNMHAADNACSTFAGSISGGQLPWKSAAGSHHFIDSNGNQTFDGYDAGRDSELPELQNIGGSDLNVSRTTQNLSLQCSVPELHITSKEPGGLCFQDSYYTATQDVNLSVRNLGSYNEFQVGTNPANFSGPWRPVGSMTTCNAAAGQRFYTAHLFSDPDLFTNPASASRGLKTVYMRFRDASGNVSDPVNDSILYGYPWISTFRGDVHSNGAINGEASFLTSALTPFTRFDCLPPQGTKSGDFVFSTVDGFQMMSSFNNECGDSHTLTTQGSWYYDGAGDNVPEVEWNTINIPALESEATTLCSGSVTLVSQNGSLVPQGACSSNPGASSELGQLIFVDGDLTINDALTIPDAVFGSSGALTVATTGTITVNNNLAYQSTSPALTSSRQLGSLALLAQGNIVIGDNVATLVGLYFSQQTIQTTSSAVPIDKKLSLYGSLVANDISFFRNYLGQ